ncbi:hypothetical protein [Geopsychrobacter electrodiphilus]|uniref:hypothetical protein n=1 Tax=Geopsychrobacter electrodiphilus TaxID=225196 RepID=UPI00037CCE8F|nr:hypothetical protein [Geopsychrobacter electrodiphilus]
MKNKRKMLIASLMLLTFSTPAFAWMNDWSDYRMNRGSAAATDTQSLTVEQQKKVDEIEGKYQPQLQELQGKLNAKQDELLTARSDDATTLGRLNALEAELYKLENDYWTDLDQANLEMSRVAGGGYSSWFACDYRGCNHNNGRHGMMNRREMMRDGHMMSGNNMSGSNYGTCCR